VKDERMKGMMWRKGMDELKRRKGMRKMKR